MRAVAEQIDSSPGVDMLSLIRGNPNIEATELFDVTVYLQRRGLMTVEIYAGIDNYYMSSAWLTEKIKINDYLSGNLPKESLRHFIIR